MIIPDYLIIDEIKRREEKHWQPEVHQIPLYIPDAPDLIEHAPKKNNNNDAPNTKRENGAIIINLLG